MLQKNAEQGNVKISYCNDDSFIGLFELEVPFSQILHKNDDEKYFHIPIKQHLESKNLTEYSTIKDLGINVSTGPIVDFRMKKLLLKDYTENSCPLVYSVHLKNHRLVWPQNSKKPNAILELKDVEKQLFPKGFYILVKRFSTKEEKKRVVASIITPNDFIKNNITFENHLNVFHIDKTWDMKRDGIPVLRGKQSKFIFIQMKERVNQNRFKVQNIAANVRCSLL